MRCLLLLLAALACLGSCGAGALKERLVLGFASKAQPPPAWDVRAKQSRRKKPPGGTPGQQIRRKHAQLDIVKSSPEHFQSLVDGRKVAVLKHALWGDMGEARSAEATEAWTAAFFETFAEELVTCHAKEAATGAVRAIDVTLSEFVHMAFQSNHQESYYLLDEGLLASTPSLLSSLALPSKWFGQDKFRLFPKELRPKQPCLIMGGAGSRSSLHADPMEWTGWNYLFEGSKLWTFLPPGKDTERALRSRRVLSGEWDGGSFNISAGWQSDVDLYMQKISGGGRSGDWPSAPALGVMPSIARDYALGLVEGACFTDHPFTPSDSSIFETLAHGVTLEDGRIAVLQREGDLVHIPPGWWHQTYHLEPSVAIAGQYLNPRNFNRVASHISTWSGVAVQDPGAHFQQMADEKGYDVAIQELLSQALCAKHGEDKGRELFSGLNFEWL